MWVVNSNREAVEVTVATGTKTGRTIRLDTNSADIVVNPENTILYGVNTAGQIRAFDTDTGNLLGQYNIGYPGGVLIPGGMQFNSIAFDKDGNLITAAEYVRANLALEHRHIWKAVDKQQAANPSTTNPPSLTPTPLTEPPLEPLISRSATLILLVSGALYFQHV